MAAKLRPLYNISCAIPIATSDPMAVVSISSTSVIASRLVFLVDVILQSISGNESAHVALAQNFRRNPLHLDGDQPEFIAVAFADRRSGDCYLAGVADAAGGLCPWVKCIDEIRWNKRSIGKLIPTVQ